VGGAGGEVVGRLGCRSGRAVAAVVSGSCRRVGRGSEWGVRGGGMVAGDR